MKAVNAIALKAWRKVGTRFLPLADVATPDLPMSRLLRLSLFQVSVGMALALVVGTLNRVMIVELGIPAWLVSIAIALPLAFAPFRALIGFKSDHHRSVLGWRRVPYLWLGTLIQFGGLAIMPFALLLLSGDTTGPAWIGDAAAALAFLMVGAGVQTTQTAGLALATDLASREKRPRVVALMYIALLIGIVGSGSIFGLLLRDFSEVKLIQVIQGAAALTMALNLIALWKQEARDPDRVRATGARPEFKSSWLAYARTDGAKRFLTALGIGTASFNMQDIILEPYGGEILGLDVSQTASLTAILAGGALIGYLTTARLLGRGSDPYRLAGYGIASGLPAFALVIISGALGSPVLFRIGAILIGFGGGVFSVATLAAAMNIEDKGSNGLALGAWGATQVTAAGLAMAFGGVLHDGVGSLAISGALGPALSGPATGYGAVYYLELVLLFAALIIIGPLARYARPSSVPQGYDLAATPR